MLTNNQTDLLPIVIEGQAFKPNEDGMWSLTAIHKALGLPDNKRPGQWSKLSCTEVEISTSFMATTAGPWQPNRGQ
ncbi:hypothetical protein [Pseudomonas sp. SDO5271_S396]